MNRTAILEGKYLFDYVRNYSAFLAFENYLISNQFDWLQSQHIDNKIIGKGNLQVGDVEYKINFQYSPFFVGRFDRIYVESPKIMYNSKIHIYPDLSLCLYHPVQDRTFGNIVPLNKMIPWISEWCIHYEEWKKYKVWLGKEILH